MSSETSENLYTFGPFVLDERRLVLLRSGEALALGPKVVETLLALIERRGELCTKGELLDRVWPEGYVTEGNLSQNVHVLRKTLRAWNAGAIETVPRRGRHDAVFFRARARGDDVAATLRRRSLLLGYANESGHRDEPALLLARDRRRSHRRSELRGDGGGRRDHGGLRIRRRGACDILRARPRICATSARTRSRQ